MLMMVGKIQLGRSPANFLKYILDPPPFLLPQVGTEYEETSTLTLVPVTVKDGGNGGMGASFLMIAKDLGSVVMGNGSAVFFDFD